MNTQTQYLGLSLSSPLIASASPMSTQLQSCLKMQEQGVAAIVMHSLFEEQINDELNEVDKLLFHGKDSSSEALNYFPEGTFENYETDGYLTQLRILKTALDIPVIASLNGVSHGGWLKYAKELENEGADALELNIYYPVSDPSISAEMIEAMYLEDVAAVKEACDLPFAVKIAPNFTALPNFVNKLQEQGASAVTLFNRFYQPNIDLEALEWKSVLYHSSGYDFSQTLRAIAMLYGRTNLQLGASGGVQTGLDLIRAVMAGATVVGSATALYEHGVEHASVMLAQARQWMEENEYDSFDQMRGSISHLKSPNPSALERANYIELLRKGW
jgi:dihydroorotate dehydrogenase (fumarate)